MRIGSTRGIATQSVSVCLSYKVRSRRPDCPSAESRDAGRAAAGARCTWEGQRKSARSTETDMGQKIRNKRNTVQRKQKAAQHYSLDAGGFPSNTVFTPHRSGPAQTLTL